MRIVHELEPFPAKLQSEVVVGMIADATQTDELVAIPFAAVTIATTPYEQIDVEIAFAEDGIDLDLTIVACRHLRLQTIHLNTLFGDDVHHTRQGHTAIER